MPHHPFYNSKLWRDARAKHLARHPWCCICLLLGKQVRGREVDHEVAITAGGHPTDSANLRTLCKTHHSQKTIMVDGMHRDSGKALVTTGPDGFPIHIEKQRKTHGP